MIHEFTNKMVHATFADGKLTFCTQMSDAGSEEECKALFKIWEELEEEVGQEVGIACHFSASALLDDMLDGDSLSRFPNENRVDLEDKPKYDALRAELAAMLAKLDTIKFEPFTPPNTEGQS